MCTRSPVVYVATSTAERQEDSGRRKIKETREKCQTGPQRDVQSVEHTNKIETPNLDFTQTASTWIKIFLS